ncbi:MAG: hypothetical protein H6834_08995 [Planctomycetes bacterium]|nr:hypothetical protein [Planctomycetota bacterium]
MNAPVVYSILLACSFSACTTPTELGPPIEPLAECSIRCTGSLGQDGFAERPEIEAASSPVALRSTIHVWQLPREVLGRLVPSSVPTASMILSASETERALARFREAPDSVLQVDGDLQLATEQTGFLALENQHAYIKRFVLEATTRAAILDPEIDVVQSGLRFHLRPVFDDARGPWKLEVHMESVDRPESLPMANLPTIVSHGQVTVQLPLFMRVDLETSAQLENGQSLLFTGPSPFGDEASLVAIVRPVESAPLEVAAH